MNILVACEESQTVCMAFRSVGHNAYSCDILPCSGGFPQYHILSDVTSLLDGNCSFITMDGLEHFINGSWDLIVAHPPCTYMSKAGARWMYPKAGVISSDRLAKAFAAKNFFLSIANADCSRIAIENPVPLKIVGLPPCSQKIQPFQFGDPYSKLTCLWLKGLPLLKPTHILSHYKPYCPSNTGNFSRGAGGSYGAAHDSKLRSKTFPGIALAMVQQWG